MKVRVVVTDDGGKTFEGEAILVAVTSRRRPRHAPDPKPQKATARTKPDLSLPVRAFMKQHCKGLGGAQKFTTLLAKLTGGKIGAAVGLKEIEKSWNRMTALMGGRFNPAYTTRAKDNGWVDTPKTGHYALRADWEKALDR
jgi:hypothetical protein